MAPVRSYIFPSQFWLDFMFEIFQKVKSSSPRSSRTIFQMIPPIGTHLCPKWIRGEVQEGPPPHFFETPCSLITVVLIGRLLEAAAKQRTTDSLDELVRASPPTARVNGEELPIELVPWPTWCHVVLSHLITPTADLSETAISNGWIIKNPQILSYFSRWLPKQST